MLNRVLFIPLPIQWLSTVFDALEMSRGIKFKISQCLQLGGVRLTCADSNITAYASETPISSFRDCPYHLCSIVVLRQHTDLLYLNELGLACLFSVGLKGYYSFDIITHGCVDCSFCLFVAAILAGAARLFVFLFGHLKLVLFTFASYVPPF